MSDPDGLFDSARPAPPARLEERLRARARELGFGLFGIADADPSRHAEHYREWIEAGRHGAMEYLARPDAVARRADLRRTMDDVRSVVVVGHEYHAPDDRSVAAAPSRAVIARYARGADYHDVVTPRLQELLDWLSAEVPGGASGRVYVDTGPVLERELARRAGLGWFGKNTMLIDPARGSYFLLGILLVDVELRPSAPFEADRCGTCSACLAACPTGALLGRDRSGAPVMDARRCISYLTIELRGPIPRELRPAIGNRVFGCDICQEVCPWNERFATPTDEPAYEARPGLDGASLVDLTSRILAMSGKGYAREFSDSPLSRPGRKGMLRNLCVALGNGRSPDSTPLLARAAVDASPLVRSHAAWALGRVGGVAAVRALRELLDVEDDPEVRAEMTAALASAERGSGGADSGTP